MGNSEGDFLNLNIAQKQITWFVQNNKDKNSFLIRARFVLSQWEQVEELIYDSSYCTKPRDDFVQVNKTLSATRKNIPYRSLLSEGSFKKIEFRVYFWPFPFPCIWRAKSKLNNQQKSNSSFEKQIFQKLFLKKAYICPDFFAYRVKGIFKRRWYPPKWTYNWIAAKRRINRHDLFGASAAGRLTTQRRAGLPVRKVRFGSVTHDIQFDVTLLSSHKPLCMRPLSDETPEG